MVQTAGQSGFQQKQWLVLIKSFRFHLKFSVVGQFAHPIRDIAVACKNVSTWLILDTVYFFRLFDSNVDFTKDRLTFDNCFNSK